MKSFLMCSMLISSLVLLAGCGSTATPTASTNNEPAAVEAGEGDGAVMLVNLKAADLLDGTEDKVVGKCYVCGLGMDGKAEHTAEYEGYSCRLCSEHCKEYFEESAATIVAETNVPTPAAE